MSTIITVSAKDQSLTPDKYAEKDPQGKKIVVHSNRQVQWKCPDGNLEIVFRKSPFKSGPATLKANQGALTAPLETASVKQRQTYPYTLKVNGQVIDPDLDVDPDPGPPDQDVDDNPGGPATMTMERVTKPSTRRPAKQPAAALAEWAYEGVECYVAECYVAGAPRENGDHARIELPARDPEGKPGSCWVAKQQFAGHVPLYRLTRKSNGDCCYGATIESLETARKRGYDKPKGEGCVGYVMLTQDAQHVPLMRTFNRTSKRYVYTTDIGEVDQFTPSITGNVLEDLVYEAFRVTPKFMDGRYFCLAEQAAKQIICSSRVAGRQYRDAVMDCDDYALLLKAAFIEDAYNIYNTESARKPERSKPHALGVIVGFSPSHHRRHAMNILVTSEGKDYKLWLVEPQTGELLPLPGHESRLEKVDWVMF